MNYYKTLDGTFYWADENRKVVAGSVKITQAEFDAYNSPTPAELKDAANAIIKARLAANDLTIIRALTEGDTARIAAHKALQTALRAQLQQ